MKIAIVCSWKLDAFQITLSYANPVTGFGRKNLLLFGPLTLDLLAWGTKLKFLINFCSVLGGLLSTIFKYGLFTSSFPLIFVLSTLNKSSRIVPMSGFELRISGVGSNATGLNALANFGKTLLRIWVVTNWIYNLAYWSRLISTYTSSSIVLVGSKALSPLKVHSLTRSPRKVEVKETTDIGTLIPDCSPIHLRLLGNEYRSRCNKQILELRNCAEMKMSEWSISP